MAETVSKSKFKAHALELLRRVKERKLELVITDRGEPVATVVPYSNSPDTILARLRGTVLRYDGPTEPVAADAWEALR